jgi:hypothetical protein
MACERDWHHHNPMALPMMSTMTHTSDFEIVLIIVSYEQWYVRNKYQSTYNDLITDSIHWLISFVYMYVTCAVNSAFQCGHHLHVLASSTQKTPAPATTQTQITPTPTCQQDALSQNSKRRRTPPARMHTRYPENALRVASMQSLPASCGLAVATRIGFERSDATVPQGTRGGCSIGKHCCFSFVHDSTLIGSRVGTCFISVGSGIIQWGTTLLGGTVTASNLTDSVMGRWDT